MGTRKVRKKETARRDEGAPASGKARRTLRDLPSYTELHDERATNPVIRLTQRATALPPPLPVSDEESVTEASLDALALLARRSAPPPSRFSAAPRLVAPVATLPPASPTASTIVPPVAAAPVRPSSIPAMAVGSSSAPPAHSSTSPPRRRASDHGPRRGGLGTVILSATVGAIVALAAWTVRSGLDRVAHQNDPTGPTNALAAAAVAPPADKCPSPSAAPASSPAPAAGSTSASSTSTAESAPLRVSFDSLPMARSGGVAPATATRPASRRSTTAARASFTSTREAPEPRPVVQRAPAAPVSPRAAVTEAVQRASFAARSCESGPQSGKVAVTFSPTGAVSSVNLVKGFDDAGVNGCVLRAFGRVRVSAFEGDPITVRKTVSW